MQGPEIFGKLCCRSLTVQQVDTSSMPLFNLELLWVRAYWDTHSPYQVLGFKLWLCFLLMYTLGRALGDSSDGSSSCGFLLPVWDLGSELENRVSLSLSPWSCLSNQLTIRKFNQNKNSVVHSLVLNTFHVPNATRADYRARLSLPKFCKSLSQALSPRSVGKAYTKDGDTDFQFRKGKCWVCSGKTCLKN